MVAGIPVGGPTYEKALTVYEGEAPPRNGEPFVIIPIFCHESPILGILSATTIITEFALESSKQSDDMAEDRGCRDSQIETSLRKALTVYEEKLLSKRRAFQKPHPAWGDPMPSPFVMRARSWESSRQPLSSPSLLSSREQSRVMI